MDKKQEFLLSVEPINQESQNWLLELCNKKPSNFYNALCHYAAHQTPIEECKQADTELQQLLKELYEEWYSKFKNTKFGLFSGKKYKAFLSDPQFDPNAPEHKKYLQSFAHSTYQHLFNSMNDKYPIIAKSMLHTFPFADQNLEFVHFIVGNNKPYKPTECRLYLNAKAKNVAKIAKKVLENAEKVDSKFVFKLTPVDDRNETMVFYCTYDNVEQITSMLESIKNNNEELFEGTDQIGAHMGRVAGFLGFGEEPVASGTSFTYERAKALESYATNGLVPSTTDVPDIKSELKYFMLNKSTITELTNKNYDLKLIGCRAHSCQRGE